MAATPIQSKQYANMQPARAVDRLTVQKLFLLVCLLHRETPSAELEEQYQMALSDLTMVQAAALTEKIRNDTKFWPAPARLRELAGLPDAEQRAQAAEEQTRNIALAGLQRVLDSMRMARVHKDGIARDKWTDEAHVRGDPKITAVLTKFGGTFACAIDILISHPQLLDGSEQGESLGLTLSSIEKLEKRWIAAWKAVNQ